MAGSKNQLLQNLHLPGISYSHQVAYNVRIFGQTSPRHFREGWMKIKFHLTFMLYISQKELAEVPGLEHEKGKRWQICRRTRLQVIPGLETFD